ncbi:uncharacterized protein MYCFIDRAFT_197771 [Pseudocercospora fijiensis CIRAD86]|uniref:Uncharacterized protein n=1 Tax=Pseudocercospora fijiensis (strain CIRAD86) TaxID=383855 RepID=M2ZP61_PSEFD|nr:uncharacterized protein MYCFIDRAFT_197771 [Pseudocercospora fijiensis CIRAD86]EME80899.1 hypothetical protein MYCFIDRAFT_197771 [Pseudocercospora fijiensis CIRAD86]
MCAPLTVNCQQRNHRFTLPKNLIPCVSPGSEACKAGTAAPSQTWQVSPTDCMAVKRKNGTYDERKCISNLKQYGQKVWKMNKGLEDEKNKEKKNSGEEGGKCVVQ